MNRHININGTLVFLIATLLLITNYTNKLLKLINHASEGQTI